VFLSVARRPRAYHGSSLHEAWSQQGTYFTKGVAMECKLIKGNAIQFGTYGFEHINLPSERPDYWDTKVKVAKIADSTSLTQGRFGVTLEKASP
jgi:hypothetical protein